MAHHAGAHKSSRKQVASAQSAQAAADLRAEQHEEQNEKSKKATLGLLFSPGDQPVSDDDSELGSPRPSHLLPRATGEQPLTLEVPQLKPGDTGKVTKDDSTKKTKSGSKDDKGKGTHKDLITMEEIEATLERKHYAEDDIDFEQLKAQVNTDLTQKNEK